LLNSIPVRGRTRPGTHLAAIPGVVPSLIGDMAGCAFRNRCELAHDACAQTPPFVAVAGGHSARCVLAETLVEEPVR
jgi:peptide/nickel transport system ATP-binding protein